MVLETGRLTDKPAPFCLPLYASIILPSLPQNPDSSLSTTRTPEGEEEKTLTSEMDRGRLKQKLLHMFKLPSFWSSCSTNTRKEAALQEPIHVSRRFILEDDGVKSGVGRSLSLPHIAPSPRLCRNREETALGYSQHSADLRYGAKKTKEKPEPTYPSIKPLSPSYYHFKKMREELEREERRISSRKKKGKEDNTKKKKFLSNSYGFTSCSSDESFSSGDQGEKDIFFGSRSFSSDSSELYYLSTQKKKKKTTSRPERNLKREVVRLDDGFRPVVASSSSLSSGRQMERAREKEEAPGKRREGFAVEKRSKDPHADFRSSMVEMIVEKQMFGARDLEALLRTYLDLNDPRHHPVILQVFSEIWEALFGF